jgi:hypothetical protein
VRISIGIEPEHFGVRQEKREKRSKLTAVHAPVPGAGLQAQKNGAGGEKTSHESDHILNPASSTQHEPKQVPATVINCDEKVAAVTVLFAGKGTSKV